jgi:hypothetical protein
MGWAALGTGWQLQCSTYAMVKANVISAVFHGGGTKLYRLEPRRPGLVRTFVIIGEEGAQL